jgi:sulfatase modifying factor 1
MKRRDGLPAVAFALALTRGCGGKTLDRSVPPPPSTTAIPSAPHEASKAGAPPVGGEGASDGSSSPAPASSSMSGAASSGENSDPQSAGCQVGGNGLTDCGPNRESCCTSLEVPAGTFFRSFNPPGSDGGVALGADGGPTGEADPASVSAFRLDKYEVTVGRFRQFVTAWNGGHGWVPAAGSGKHTHLNGGLGLANSASPGTYEPGWIASDDSSITPTDENLDCGEQTWTPSAEGRDAFPINCVNWWEAYAFCIFDGGFLPTEAEWEYAAAGGSQQREYPWGSDYPGIDIGYGNYLDSYATATSTSLIEFKGPAPGDGILAPVGTATLGAGAWGQVDLTGNVSEWNLDRYAAYFDPCVDCANLTAGSNRVSRGGYWGSPRSELPVTYRDDSGEPSSDGVGDGFRCARTP